MSDTQQGRDLFRPEVRRRTLRRVDGDVILASSPGVTVLTALVLAVLVGIGVFISAASYARTVSVEGWLVARAGDSRLSSPRAGTIRSIDAAEGQLVQAGQSIAHIATAPAIQAGDEWELIRSSQQQEAMASRAKASALVASLVNERAQLLHKRDWFRAELAESRKREALQRDQLQIAKDEVARAAPVAAKGFISSHDFQARRAAAIEAEQQLGSMIAASAEIERNVGDAEAALRDIPIRLRAAEADAAVLQAQQHQALTRSEADGVYVVQAPRSGRVTALSASGGQTVAADALIAVLAPENSQVEAELYAPSQAAGLLRVGQPVRLYYRAFPHERFGAGHGRVLSISHTALPPSDVSAPGLGIQEPVYKLRVSLDRSAMQFDGRSIPLLPGNRLSAQIEIERHTLLAWIFGPLVSGRAFS